MVSPRKRAPIVYSRASEAVYQFPRRGPQILFLPSFLNHRHTYERRDQVRAGSVYSLYYLYTSRNMSWSGSEKSVQNLGPAQRRKMVIPSEAHGIVKYLQKFQHPTISLTPQKKAEAYRWAGLFPHSITSAVLRDSLMGFSIFGSQQI